MENLPHVCTSLQTVVTMELQWNYNGGEDLQRKWNGNNEPPYMTGCGYVEVECPNGCYDAHKEFVDDE